MKKQVITILIFCILLAVTFFYVYKTYIPSSKDYFNVSIVAENNGERQITQLDINGQLINTSYIYELIQATGLVTIKNINLPKQNFYEDTIEYNITKNTRIDYPLRLPEIPQITSQRINQSLIINFKSENFKDAKFCLKGTQSYLFITATRDIHLINISKEKDSLIIKSTEYNPTNYQGWEIKRNYTITEEYPKIPKDKFSSYEKCYDSEFSINGERNINVSYKEFSKPTENDYIEIVVYDKAGNEKIEKVL